MGKDLIIIGGGPGGYVAAIRAAQLGADVCLIENRRLGGTCLNRGCIPTKALFRNAEVISMMKESEQFGVSVEKFNVDAHKIQQRKRDVVEQLVGGIEKLVSSYKNIEFISGTGTIIDKNTVHVKTNEGEEKDITAKNIIIATGSESCMPDIPGIDLEGVVDSDGILEFKEIPKRLVVIGGGVIGVEFASIFNGMGSKVTLIASRILKNVDKDICRRLPSFMKKRGIDVYVDIRAKEIVKTENGLLVKAQYKTKPKQIEVEADMVLVASGRNPLIKGLNLEKVGIAYSEKGIEVDENYETNIKGIYAIGDVNGGIQLAHVASHQGIYVVERIMGLNPHNKHDIVPNCVFTFPEVAFVGATEDELKESGINYNVSKFMFGANGKALAMGETEGFIKVISNADDDRILGVYIIGPHASDLIHEGTLAINKELNVDDIKNTIHAHPTLSEAFVEAVLGLKGEAIHVAPRKR